MKDDVIHRMTRRLLDWDYCQRAIYMITVTLEDRTREWLGHLVYLDGNGEDQTQPCGGRWAIAPTPFGQAVFDALDEMPRLFPQVKILERQLMPEHLHFAVFVDAPLPKPLGALIRGFKAGAAKRWKMLAENGEPQNTPRPAEPQGHPRPAEPQGHPCAAEPLGHPCPAEPAGGRSMPSHSCDGIPRWADGFQDTILFREGQLASMIAYIRANPSRLAEKRANPGLFRRVANVCLPLDGGRLVGRFEALGNRHLLSRTLHQVQCSRQYFAWRRVPKPGGGLKIARDAAAEPVVERTTGDYDSRLADALAAAGHGAVIVSPCISDGERQIAIEAHKRKLPLVALRNMGFAKLQKPAGRLFDACAEGRLLLLAPAAWPYSTQEKPMTRRDATALNRICQWLAGEDAVEIDYHGIRPADIDRIAMEAMLATKEGGRL